MLLKVAAAGLLLGVVAPIIASLLMMISRAYVERSSAAVNI
jgi:hypothetical protein